jgi:N-methylhydantoinase B
MLAWRSEMSLDQATALNPVTIEIIRSGLNAAADEMNATLIRSAYTPVIYEMKDCSVGLLDDHHQILGQSAGLPIFLGNLEVVTELTELRFGREGWHPGDVWILNDSYMAGTHLHDMTVYGPVFVGDELVGFATCRAHWLDVGSKDACGSTDSVNIFQEGLRLGPTKVVDRGELLDDVVDVLTRNGRFPYPARGDLFAQIGCVKTGQERLSRLISRYGVGTVRTARDEIFAQTERLEREAVSAIPDGHYVAEGSLDNDGVTDHEYMVRVAVDIRADTMTLDLTGTDDVAVGPINCGAPQAISAARVAYKLLVNPDRPVDGGAFRPLEVKVRPGSLLAAEEPAPCEWYFTPLGLLIDLVVKALAPALPERVAAASYGDSMVIGIEGRDPRNGGTFMVYEPTVGGWGAWHGGDGQGALINNVNGSLKDVPIEVAETKYPVWVRRYAVRRDSGGAGQWRGGNGVEREYVLEADAGTMSLWFERSLTPAWGLAGGQDATPPEVVVNEGDPGSVTMLKVNAFRLLRGDSVICRTGGGGGYGDPRARSKAAVEADLRNGAVSPEVAHDTYGYTGG